MRIVSTPWHKFKNGIYLPSPYLYFVAHELAAILFGCRVTDQADFLVQAMRNALEYEYPQQIMYPGNTTGNTDSIKIRCLHAAAVAWVSHTMPHQTVQDLIMTKGRIYYTHPCGPVYGGPPRLDEARWY